MNERDHAYVDVVSSEPILAALAIEFHHLAASDREDIDNPS